MKPLLPHHAAWLSAHPNRSEAWLRERLRDKFDVHHVDGDKNNNDPSNLVLIESSDHIMLHNGGTRILRMSYQDRKRAHQGTQGQGLKGQRPGAKAEITNVDGLARLYGVSAETIIEWRSGSRLLSVAADG